MEKLSLLPRAEPFFFAGNRVGCLLIHGFTGAPQEMRELGERLAAEEFTVLGPRLTHHGTHPAHMLRSSWQDWYFSALDGWHLLNQICDQIVVIGLSMGGATALLMAAQQPVTAVVSLSAPVRLVEDPRLKFTRHIGKLYPFAPRLEENWREMFDPNGRIAYPSTPVPAIGELKAYLQRVEKSLPKIEVPTLLIHAADDETVAPINLHHIYRQLTTAEKSKFLYDQGSHVITEGVEKERLFAQVIGFVTDKANKKRQPDQVAFKAS